MAPPLEGVPTAPVLKEEQDAAVALHPCLFRIFSAGQIVEEAPFRIQHGKTRLGREAGVEPFIVLPGDPGISREHAQLEYDQVTQVCTLTDTSSRQSTWLNGDRLARGTAHKLAPQDVIRLGDTVLIFSSASATYFSLFTDGTGVHAQGRAAKLLGRAPAIVELRGKLAKVACSKEPLPLLLLGESGTGKERAAEEFHIASGRRTFKPVNCAVLDPALADSTLFGHIRGAFTGTVQNRDGLFVAGHNGTIFLDEVAELPAEVQAKLLRVLAERVVYPKGAEEKDAKRVDVLVIAATSRPLVEDVRGGAFRFDLFRRLNGISLRVPSLRHRREDILYLLQHAPATRKHTNDPAPIPALPPLKTSQVELLLLHHWPGNVADLIFVRGHITTLGFDSDLIERLRARTPASIEAVSEPSAPPPRSPPSSGAPPAAPPPVPPPPGGAAGSPDSAPPAESPSAHKEPRPSATRVRELLQKHSGNLVQMEKETGWNRRTLRDLVHEHGLADLMEQLRTRK